ncbi:3,5-dihydroxyphenylacetyl-CoA synthase DpgA [Streptomyces pseudovenezuelae]|uniref:Type III polyketide synthase n=1 Tax=Streptomyces pseudovenezuelae TaxID=67350 RepID=A0ABZ1X8E2_9ACTN|nr:3,5-dihydroxyphenylacetyl-CoA synthase DpgA [Streptomyces pseudovenezuelae]WUA86187.1 type III polyketide synthase [Streptomyces pseudovenezuelae]
MTRNAGSLARIMSVGTAVPPASYTQEELLSVFGVTDPRIRSVFLNSAIERRHLTLPPCDADGIPRTETQGDLLRKHSSSGLLIGREAIETCLKRLGADPSDVAFLCCVSSTGLLTPGFSALLIKELGLRPTCGRLDVVGMGCNAGLNALAAVTGWASAHPGRLALMVSVEVCSAAYVFDGTMRTSVVNSLFGDGAAALAVVAEPEPEAGADAEPSHSGAGPSVLGYASRIITDAIDAMRYDWDEDHERFSFFLDPEVPYVVGAHAEETVDRLLDEAGLHRSDISHWVIHSGGKKVIDAVRVNLGLTRHDVRHTLSVLRDYGNLSSGAFLFSLRQLWEEGTVRPGDHGVMMTMGPGSTIETALLRW